MTRPVGVVVVAYHSADLLRQALASVPAGLPTVVVDNSSSAQVSAAAAEHGARYHDAGDNLGFAAGVNRGVRLLHGILPHADVLLLNPDAVLAPGTVEALSTGLHADPRRAAVSPVLVTGDGSPQRVLWPWPSPGGAWFEAVGLGHRRRSRWLVGAVLLLSSKALEEVGGFDERFFLYAEETDWQRRAAGAGWELALVEQARADHVGAGTSSDTGRREVLFHAGQETYIRKWFGRAGWTSYRTATLLGAAARGILLRGDRGRAARHRVALYSRGPRRKAGLDRLPGTQGAEPQRKAAT